MDPILDIVKSFVKMILNPVITQTVKSTKRDDTYSDVDSRYLSFDVRTHKIDPSKKGFANVIQYDPLGIISNIYEVNLSRKSNKIKRLFYCAQDTR
jgi:hypothetical protein